MNKDLINRLRSIHHGATYTVHEAADIIEGLENERDQLHKCVTLLRGYLVSIHQKAKSRDAHWVECTADEALAATKPKE